MDKKTTPEQQQVPAPGRRRRWRPILIAIGVLVLALAGYRVWEATRPPAASVTVPINVTVGTAHISSIYATSPLTGRIEPTASASVIPLAAGTVTSVDVELGQEVREGDLLFTIDSAPVATSYQQAKIGYDTARADFLRIETLYKEGAVSLQQYQGAKAQMDLAAQSLASASEALSNYRVTAPIDGFVTSVNVSVGSLVSQAMPAVTIADTSSLKIQTGISEYLISRVHPDDEVDIFVRTASDAPLAGRITAVSPAPAAGTLTYPVTITVDDPDGVVRAGMFAEIQLVSDKREDVLCVPSEAVFIKSGVSRVVVLKDRIPTIVTVTTGLDNGTLAEITSGLSEGDIIVTTGQQYVVDGEAVNVVGQ